MTNPVTGHGDSFVEASAAADTIGDALGEDTLARGGPES